MKKLLTLTAVGTLLAVPAIAVQKCVALDAENTTCTSTPEYGKADWSATCTTNGTSVSVKGMAVCSNITGGAALATSDTITTIHSDSDTFGFGHCWCKIVSPVESTWVYSNFKTILTDAQCLYQCSYRCANLLTSSTSTLLNVLINSISN